MLEADVAVHRRFLRAGPVLFGGRIQNLRNSTDRNASFAHLGDHAPQPAHRPDDHRVVDRERDELTLSHLAFHAEQTAEHHDQHRLDTGSRIADRPEI